MRRAARGGFSTHWLAFAAAPAASRDPGAEAAGAASAHAAIAGARDEALLAASARGDRAALDELFRRHGREVRGTLMRLGTIAERDLEDLVQATFLEVRRSASRFGARAAVATWIVGIALNLARHHVRGESRRRAALSAVAEAAGDAGPARPDEEAARRQMLGRLQPAMDSLPPYLRVAFTMCDLEGMRGTDAARALSVPEGTVWRRVHEARSRLRAVVMRPTSPTSAPRPT